MDPKNAENLYIYLTGTQGTVYEYGLQLKVVENSREETRTFGSEGHPYRLAFISDANDDNTRYYEWDFSAGEWGLVRPNG